MNREHGDGLVQSFKLVQKLLVGTNASIKSKNLLMQESVSKLHDINQQNGERVRLNKKDLLKQDREKIRYLSSKAHQRDNSVREIRSALLEDLEQKREI